MQQRTVYFAFFAIWLCLSVLLVTWALRTASAATNRPLSQTEQIDMLRETLRQNPDLVLDVLRDHSEAVLDIAQQGANQRRNKALTVQWRKDLEDPKDVNIQGRPLRGKADAPVTIVAFSDFTCPYCEQASTTVKRLLKEFPGQVRYVFKSFPLEAQGSARLAAEYFVAAGLQDPEKAWLLYDALFARREELLKNGEATLKDAATKAGLDMKRLNADAKSKAVKTLVDDDIAEGVRLGVKGTPYFLVNDLVVRGALSPELFAEAVHLALEEAAKTKKE